VGSTLRTRSSAALVVEPVIRDPYAAATTGVRVSAWAQCTNTGLPSARRSRTTRAVSIRTPGRSRLAWSRSMSHLDVVLGSDAGQRGVAGTEPAQADHRVGHPGPQCADRAEQHAGVVGGARPGWTASPGRCRACRRGPAGAIRTAPLGGEHREPNQVTGAQTRPAVQHAAPRAAEVTP
jgi:hypothetical protein